MLKYEATTLFMLPLEKEVKNLQLLYLYKILLVTKSIYLRYVTYYTFIIPLRQVIN